jgi:hypothetical protein
MKRLFIATGLICLFALLAFAQGLDSSQSVTAAPALKSHHLFNLPEGVSEREMAEALREMNRAIADSGHPNAGYRLWKVTGEQAGEYSYLWEGIWPNQATYDAIHESETWQKMEVRLGPFFEKIMEKQIYNRFIEIATNGRQK